MRRRYRWYTSPDRFYFTLTDDSTLKGATMTYDRSGWDGSSAEAIVERPQQAGGTPYPLRNFYSGVYFNNTLVNGYHMDHWSLHSITMVDTANPPNTMSVPSGYAVPPMPGYYVLSCFMDTQDGREHSELGMERVIHIVR